MQQILITIDVIAGVLLSLCILLQHRASGLSATFGGMGATFQRRGAERVLFQLTIWLAVIFFGIAVASLFLVKASA
jgi:protein translocase SecG subunit